VGRDFRIRDWLVKPTQNSLVSESRTIHLEPKVMEVLVYLSARASQIVSKEELISRVWPGVFVGDDALTRCISELRRALGDSRKEPRFIETLQKCGYRFVAPVHDAGEPAHNELGVTHAAALHSGRRSLNIAVMAIVLVATVAFALLRARHSANGPARSAAPIVPVQPQREAGKKSQIVNPDAYAALLKGRHYLNKRTADGVTRSLEFFQQAIDIDPTYALAYADLAGAYTKLAHYRVMPPEQVYAPARAAANMASTLDNTLAEPHAILGELAFDYEHNWTLAEAEYKKAVTLDSNYAIGHHRYGMYLGWAGRFDEALEEEQRAYELDPLSPVTNNALAMPYYFSRQYDQVIAICKSILKTQGEPGFWITHLILGYAYEEKREMNSALREFRKGVELSAGDPDALGALGHAYAISSDRRAAVAIVHGLKKASAVRYVPRFDVAIIYLGLGDTSGAFALFDEGYAEHNSDLAYYFRFDPRLDSVRSDVRFKLLMERLRLSDSSANVAATPFVKAP
jgi:DNA-binding winged helix-turn-helix (wHTH) protein/tetratricopeptide (TPR) repeat protein